MKRYRAFIVIVIVIVLAVMLGLLLQSAAREVIRSALVRTYEAVRALASAIPQPYYWALLILVIAVSAVHSIVGEEDRRPSRASPPTGGRAAEWRNWLERAAQSTSSRSFYRWQVARNLAKLSSEIIAYQEGIPPGEAERQIEDGDVVLPADVRDYFLASIWSRPVRYGSWWTRRSGAQPPSPLDLDPAQAVNLIETQMEVSHDNRNL
jgi:hypothetical protein